MRRSALLQCFSRLFLAGLAVALGGTHLGRRDHESWRDFNTYRSRGIQFVRDPAEQPYGTVAVFKDLYGNLWDLVQLRDGQSRQESR
jgi:hypothetical protein